MKRRAFLKSLAASVAGLFCANVAAKKPEPEWAKWTNLEYRTRTRAELAKRLSDPEFKRYWVRGGGITANEMRAIEA